MHGQIAYNKGMKLVTVVALRPEEPQALLAMMTRFNEACNWLSAVAFKEQIFQWLPLQRRAYHEIRATFGVTGAETVVIVRKVAAAYKNKTRRQTLATFRPRGAIPVYKHSYKRAGAVLIYGQRIPFVAREGMKLSGKHEATLVYRDGRFLLQQVVEVETPPVAEPRGFLGCDLGIKNILADSDGKVYAGGTLNGLRKRHAKLRRRLQMKGTRSAKRLLVKRRRKEGRFARAVNHCISKKVVTKAKDTGRGIALEALGGVRDRITVRKAQRRQHHSWSFEQLRTFIEYKAALSGVMVAPVDPRNTSRTCPLCGLVDKANRKTQAEFLCVSCGYAGLADTIAAVNIARRAVDGRAVSDQPDAASLMDSCKSLCVT